MAIVFRDGFDSYNGFGSSVGLASKWVVGDNPSFITGRFGTGQALRFSDGATDAINTPTLTGMSSFTLEFGYRKSGEGSGGTTFECRNGSTIHVDLIFNDDGSIDACRNGTVLGSSAASVCIIDIWYTFQMEVVISDTVGRVTIYLDDVQVLNLTSQDTRNGATTTVDNIRMQSGTAGGHDVDDFRILDTATRATSGMRCETIYPTSDGATLNLTPSTGTDHFAVVDEALASNSDYLSGSTVGDLDLLGLGNLSSTPDSIDELVVVGYAEKTDATARSIALGVKSGSTTTDGSDYSLSQTGGRHERVLATDPDTAAAWTESGVNALQLQPKVTV
jgi:hypothetical protein